MTQKENLMDAISQLLVQIDDLELLRCIYILVLRVTR